MPISFVSGVTVKVHENAVRSLFTNPKGPVALYIRKLGVEVESMAKFLAPSRTGRLKASIKMTKDRSVTGAYGVKVGSSVRYALVVEEGAAAHVITPRRPGGYLKFKRGGATVLTKRVDHPGFRGKHYLLDALKVVIRSQT